LFLSFEPAKVGKTALFKNPALKKSPAFQAVKHALAPQRARTQPHNKGFFSWHIRLILEQ
jgi:hypothetical protein